MHGRGNPMASLYSKFSLRATTIVLASCSIVFCFYLLTSDSGVLINRLPSPLSYRQHAEQPKPKFNKTILIFTSLFNDPQWPTFREEQSTTYLKEKNCPETYCHLTYDKAKQEKSDVLIFHARDMPSAAFLRGMKRPPNQRWVYFISETPINTPDPFPLNGIFNWTMTYRTDSDIFLPYAGFERFTPVSANEQNYAQGKTKLVAWIVSHCGLLREKYVLELEKYIKVEVAGGCKNTYKHQFDCPKGQQCEIIMKKDFKFYLAFENGHCQDYVTEKYWHWPILNNVVPIVMGGGPYNLGKIAIPGSFINVEDFESIKDLADYLLYLDKNDTAYNEYFQWKKHFHVTVQPTEWPFVPFWSCKICQMLHSGSLDGYKVYDKLSEFWGVRENCENRDKKVQTIISSSIQSVT